MNDPLREERRDGPREHRHQNPAGRTLIGTKDVTMAISILTLGGMVWAMYSKPTRWDRAAERIDVIEPKVMGHETQLAVLIERLEGMNKHLASIDRKLGR